MTPHDSGARPPDTSDPGRNWRRTGSRSPESNPRPTKRSWLFKYHITLLFMMVPVTMHGAIRLFVYFHPLPEIQLLQNQFVKVLSWQRLHPQLRVLWPDGRSSYVEFPNTNIYGKRGSEYFVLSLKEQQQFVGRYCQMWSRPVKFSIQGRHQVFALDCGDGVGLDFGKAVESYRLETQPDYWVPSIFFVLVIIPLFIAETIRNRRLILKSKLS